MIDRRLANGGLPLDPPLAVYGGLCNKCHVCAGCDQPIHLGGIELETVAAGGNLRFHHPTWVQYAAHARTQLRAARLQKP